MAEEVIWAEISRIEAGWQVGSFGSGWEITSVQAKNGLRQLSRNYRLRSCKFFYSPKTFLTSPTSLAIIPTVSRVSA
jgi:hypothetical protein